VKETDRFITILKSVVAVAVLDSRLRGNDGSAEAATASQTGWISASAGNDRQRFLWQGQHPPLDKPGELSL